MLNRSTREENPNIFLLIPTKRKVSLGLLYNYTATDSQFVSIEI